MNWLFKELLVIALGCKENLSSSPSEIEWKEAYQQAEMQALVGILFNAIEKLNKDDKSYLPPKPLFYQWMGYVLQIESRNEVLKRETAHLYSIIKGDGLRCCILKGQGIACLYPNDLRRQSGDIDIWVEGGRGKVLKYLKGNCFCLGQIVIHHVDARIIDDVETEVHYIPCYTYNPFLQHRLQRFFRQHADEQFSNIDKELGFAYPTFRFNAVYILAHIYMHFLYEGIGLRQIVDYYYVLKNLDDEGRKLAASDIKKVGLQKFAGAVMFVLQRVCGMDDNSLVMKPDDKRGELLLDEIMRSGNFGKYDDRLKNRKEEDLIWFNLVALKRQLRFLRYYPMDVISIPFFKVWHWCWRKKNGYR